MNILCKFGIHQWIYDRIADLIDRKCNGLKFRRMEYSIRMKHCGYCGKIKLTVPDGTVVKHIHE
jgi:hypothetical protein